MIDGKELRKDMNRFVKVSSLLAIPVLLFSGCAKLNPQHGRMPGPPGPEEGFVKVALGFSLAGGGLASKGIPQPDEEAMRSVNMFVFMENGVIDFQAAFTPEEIAARKKTVRLRRGMNIVWVLANYPVPDSSGIGEEDDLYPLVCGLLGDHAAGNFPMICRQVIQVDPDGKADVSTLVLSRMVSKIRFKSVTNALEWPNTGQDIRFCAAYLCNAATRYSIGGPVSDPVWTNQEGCRNHDRSSVIGRDASPYSEEVVRDYYMTEAFPGLEGWDASAFAAKVAAEMDTWSNAPGSTRPQHLVKESVDHVGHSFEHGKGASDPVHFYDLSFTRPAGKAFPRSEYCFYPDDWLVATASYPVTQSLMHAYRADSVIAPGETVLYDGEFYCMPNGLENPNAGYHDTFVPTATVLMVVAEIGGSRYWYPIPLVKGLEPNMLYEVSLTVKDVGNDSAHWFDPAPEKVHTGFVIVVKDWMTGGAYPEVL